MLITDLKNQVKEERCILVNIPRKLSEHNVNLIKILE